MYITKEIEEIMVQRFGHDTLLSFATSVDNVPSVRIVDSYYEDGCFYTVTYTLSNKMKQLMTNPNVAVCGDWFTAHGIGKNLGWVKDKKNASMMSKLHAVFAEWYDNGHTNEDDENTCLLCIELTDAILFANGKRYDIEFGNN